MNKRLIVPLALLLIAVFVSGYGFAVLTTERTIPNVSTIITDVNLSVYENGSTSEELIRIEWGNLLPTQTKTFSLWIQNDADISMSISFSTRNWIPDYAEESMGLSYAVGSWGGASGYPVLDPHVRGEVRISLTASDNPPSGDFSFDLVITGTSV